MGLIHTEPPQGYSFAVKKFKRLLFQPCQPSPAAWIEAAGGALIQLWWSYNIFDLKHFIHVVFGRSWIQGLRILLGKAPRGGTRGRHSVRLVFRGAQYTPAAFVMFGEIFMFKLLVLADRVTWWLWFGNILANFVANWWSTAYKMAGCDHSPGRHWFSSELAIGGWAGVNTYQIGPGWLNCAGTEGSVMGSTISIPNGSHFQGGFSVQTFFTLSPANVELNCMVVNNTTGQVIQPALINYDASQANGQAITFIVDYHAPPSGGPHDIQFLVAAMNGAAHGSFFTPGTGFAFASWQTAKFKRFWSPYSPPKIHSGAEP